MVDLLPGRYRLELYVRDFVGRRLGIVERMVAVPAFPKERTAVSSFVSAFKADEAEASGDGIPHQFGHLRLYPKPNRRFGTGQRLLAFLEVYLPEKPASADPQVSVRFTLRRGEETVLDETNRFRPRVSKPDTVDVLKVLSGPALAAGTYQLEALVSEEGGSFSDLSRLDFEVGAAQEMGRLNTVALPPELSPAQQYFRKGYHFLVAGRYDEAVRLFRISLDYEPFFQDARRGKARAEILGGNPEEGEKTALEAVSRDGADVEALALLGLARFRLGNYGEAADAYRKALESAGEDVGLLNALGETEFAMGNREAAVATLTRSLELARPAAGRRVPRRGEALPVVTMLLSLLLAAAVSAQTAGEIFQQAKEALDQKEPSKALSLLAPLAPESPDADTPKALAPVYLLRGVAELALGNDAGAASRFETAVTLDPSLAAARFNLGRLRLGQKRYLEAREEFRKLVELEPKDASAYHLLGVACHESGAHGEARAALQKALELRPGNVQSSLRLATVLSDLGLYQEAVAAFEQAIAGGAAGAPVRKALARAELKRGAFKEAAEELQRVVEAGESSASVLVDLGYCLLNTGRFEEARARFGEALALEPENHFAQFHLGITLSKLGERDAAITSLLSALSEPSVGADAHNELARLYTASGEIDRAVEHCRLAIEDAPYLVDAYYQLGRLLARQGKGEEAQAALARFQELSKTQEEVERFEHAARIAPDNVTGLFELAKLYRRQAEAPMPSISSRGRPSSSRTSPASRWPEVSSCSRRESSRRRKRRPRGRFRSRPTMPRPSIWAPRCSWQRGICRRRKPGCAAASRFRGTTLWRGATSESSCRDPVARKRRSGALRAPSPPTPGSPFLETGSGSFIPRGASSIERFLSSRRPFASIPTTHRRT
jgi:tetratricopeptide (TPR) repeat protein